MKIQILDESWLTFSILSELADPCNFHFCQYSHLMVSPQMILVSVVGMKQYSARRREPLTLISYISDPRFLHFTLKGHWTKYIKNPCHIREFRFYIDSNLL